MNQIIALGNRMMDEAKTYPNDKIANEFSRVGDLLVHQGMPYVKKLSETDMLVVKFFKQKFN